MSDFSIKNNSVNQNNYSSRDTSAFSKMKSEYNAFLAKSKQSDFTNSPTFAAKQLEMLEQLEALALKENLNEELEDIQQKKAELQEKITPQQTDISPQYYYVPFEIKHSGKEIASLFNQKDDDYHVNMLINQCKDESDETIPQETFDAVSVLSESNIEPNFVAQILDNIQENNNIDTFKDIAALKQSGLDDTTVLKFSKLFNEKYENPEILKTSLLKMNKAGITPDTSVRLVKALSVPTENNEKKISQKAVESALNIKKTLSSTRNNEKNERNNPINKLGVTTYMLDDNNMLIMRGNEVLYVSPTEGESVHDAVQEYNDLITTVEENLLVNLVEKYKSEDGEIDSKYLRIISALRRSGVAYPQIPELIDFCIDKDGKIDNDKLTAVNNLKKSGTLGKDIIPILNSCQQEPNGNLLQEDVQNACELSSAVIGGEETSALLNEVRGNNEALQFYTDISNIFEDKSTLTKFIPMVKDNDGDFNLNRADILYNFAESLILNADEPMKNEDFMQTVNSVLKTAQDSDGTVSDDASGTCAIMLSKKFTTEDIKEGLNICKDNTGKIDDSLSEILWNMCLGNANMEQIKTAVEACKDSDGNIDYEYAKETIERQNSLLNYT